MSNFMLYRTDSYSKELSDLRVAMKIRSAYHKAFATKTVQLQTCRATVSEMNSFKFKSVGPTSTFSKVA